MQKLTWKYKRNKELIIKDYYANNHNAVTQKLHEPMFLNID